MPFIKTTHPETQVTKGDMDLPPSKWGKLTTRMLSSFKTLLNVEAKFDEIKVNQGAILSELNRSKSSRNIQDYEFKVFSQWGEDGIIQKLVNSIEIKNRTFIEFGVEDFSESNCRFLMSKDNWSGFVMDGATNSIRSVNNAYWNWRYELRAYKSFITRENINELLDLSEFDEDLGLLSIDIDGVDYFILESISKYKPRILVLEYNAIFGDEAAVTVPYDAGFVRTAKHHSNMYFGASLPALTYLAEAKGYTFVGTNSAGVNAFFVRNDLFNEKLMAHTAKSGYTPSKVRESLGPEGNLILVSGPARLEQIRGLPVVNVITGQTQIL